jgi:hypothetical protein
MEVLCFANFLSAHTSYGRWQFFDGGDMRVWTRCGFLVLRVLEVESAEKERKFAILPWFFSSEGIGS